MLPALALTLAAQAIPTAINLGKAFVQGQQAKKLAKTPRPDYNIPQGLQDAVQQARYIAGMRELPGQNLMEQRLGANLGTGVSELKNVSANPSDLASNVARLYSSQNQGINDIGMAAGQNWLNNQSGLNAALQELAKYQDKEWTINKFQPYENNMAAAAALREGSFRNLSSAGTNIASGLSGAGNIMNQQDMLKQLLGYQSDAKTNLTSGSNATLSQAITTPQSVGYNQMSPEQQDEYLKSLGIL